MVQPPTMTEHLILRGSEILGEGEAVRVRHYPLEDDAEAIKQRRKIQNRKNQRAHREYFP